MKVVFLFVSSARINVIFIEVLNARKNFRLAQIQFAWNCGVSLTLQSNLRCMAFQGNRAWLPGQVKYKIWAIAHVSWMCRLQTISLNTLVDSDVNNFSHLFSPFLPPYPLSLFLAHLFTHSITFPLAFFRLLHLCLPSFFAINHRCSMNFILYFRNKGNKSLLRKMPMSLD